MNKSNPMIQLYLAMEAAVEDWIANNAQAERIRKGQADALKSRLREYARARFDAYDPCPNDPSVPQVLAPVPQATTEDAEDADPSPSPHPIPRGVMEPVEPLTAPTSTEPTGSGPLPDGGLAVPEEFCDTILGGVSIDVAEQAMALEAARCRGSDEPLSDEPGDRVEFGHNMIGRSWGALLSEYTGTRVPDLPGWLVSLLMVALKNHRHALPFRCSNDDAVDGINYFRFAHRMKAADMHLKAASSCDHQLICIFCDEPGCDGACQHLDGKGGTTATWRNPPADVDTE